MRSLVKPFDNVSLHIKNDAASAICPAHISNRNEERGGQPIQFADLAAANSELPGKTHGADVERVRLFHDASLELRQHRIRTHVIHISQKLTLRKVVS